MTKAPEPFADALQKVCALTFWTNRVASALHDIAASESVDGDHYQQAVVALARLHSMSKAWLLELDPLWSEGESGTACGGSHESSS